MVLLFNRMKEMTMTNAKANTRKAARKAITAAKRRLIASAASLGHGVAGGYQAAVDALKSFTLDDKGALADFGVQYKAGYMVRYFEANMPRYLKRVGNMDLALRVEDALTIYAKPAPDTTKANRRTDLEHKACRAADVSWNTVKARAGLAKPKTRKPRPAVVPANPVPVDLVKASPKLATKEAVNDHFATAAAALLATVNVNAKRVSPQLSSLIEDFHQGCIKLGLIKASK
jgi:hypothetical protein